MALEWGFQPASITRIKAPRNDRSSGEGGRVTMLDLVFESRTDFGRFESLRRRLIQPKGLGEVENGTHHQPSLTDAESDVECVSRLVARQLEQASVKA